MVAIGSAKVLVVYCSAYIQLHTVESQGMCKSKGWGRGQEVQGDTGKRIGLTREGKLLEDAETAE